MRKTVSRTLAALLGAGVALVAPVAVSPAEAACGGAISFYNNSDGTALLDSVCSSIRDRSVCYRLGTAATNRTSFIRNTYSGNWIVFDDGYCSSTPGVIYGNSSGAMTGGFNNTISSYYRA
jgi:hypothetical protein